MTDVLSPEKLLSQLRNIDDEQNGLLKRIIVGSSFCGAYGYTFRETIEIIIESLEELIQEGQCSEN